MANVPLLAASPELSLEIWTYPLASDVRNEIVSLLRTEWVRTDFNWLEAMHGDYSDGLAMTTVVARLESSPVATATIIFAQSSPEVAILANVLTRRRFRGRGIGSHVVEAAIAEAASAGCRLCLLGTQAKESNLYSQLGFEWHRGVIMRRPLVHDDSWEAECFRAGQDVIVRPAAWKDWPALTHFSVQSSGCYVLDYPRGLASGRCDEIERCASTFPLLMDSVQASGGDIYALATPDRRRVLGFGSVTSGAGPLRRHTAIVELALHDNYAQHAGDLLKRLLQRCSERGVERSYAYVVDVDARKRQWFLDAGFQLAAALPEAVQIDGQASNVTVLERRVADRPPRQRSGVNGEAVSVVHQAHGINETHLDIVRGR